MNVNSGSDKTVKTQIDSIINFSSQDRLWVWGWEVE